MDPVQILFPIFPLIFLTYLHTFFNANTIRKAIQSKELDWRWMKFMPSWQQIPDDVQASREHYKNLYQAPLLFYLYCILAFTAEHVTQFTVIMAWIYVIARTIHFIIRSINPKISKRAPIFTVTLFVSLALWIELLCAILP